MLLTNDLDNGTADIYDAALPDGRIVTLEPGQSVKDWAKHFKGTPLVIDFGGFVESRVIEAAEPDEMDEQKNLKRWSGGKFDPERFDLAKTDKAVRGALRRRTRR